MISENYHLVKYISLIPWRCFAGENVHWYHDTKVSCYQWYVFSSLKEFLDGGVRFIVIVKTEVVAYGEFNFEEKCLWNRGIMLGSKRYAVSIFERLLSMRSFVDANIAIDIQYVVNRLLMYREFRLFWSWSKFFQTWSWLTLHMVSQITNVKLTNQ